MNKSNSKSDIRASIEKKFGRWGEFSGQHPWWVIAGFLLVISAFASNLSHLTIDTSNEGLLDEANPVRLAYNEFRYQFGRDERAIVIVDTDDTIYSQEFLEKLQSLHNDLEENALRIEAIDSLVNARRTYGEGDSLIVEDLLEEMPASEAGFARLERIIKSNPMYQGQFIGDTDTTTFIYIETDAFSQEGMASSDDAIEGFEDEFESPDTISESSNNTKPKFLSGRENQKIVASIDAVVARHQSDNFRVMVGGSPHFMNALLISVMDGMTLLTLSVIGLIAIILTLIFKKLVLVFLPLLVSTLSVILTVSILAMLGIPFTVVLQLMPVLLLAVGVSNSVHIFNAFFHSFSDGNDKHTAIVEALEHSGFAIAMSAFTTACGLLSFGAAELLPVAHFGLSSAAGIIFSFVFSVGLLPALISVLPISENTKKSSIHDVSQTALRYMGKVSSRYPFRVSAVWITLFAISIASTADIKLSHLPIKWLLPEEPSRVSMERLDEHFGGSMSLEIVIDTGKDNGIKDPDILRRMAEIYDIVKTYNGKIEVSKATSIVDIVKETHQALNENNEDFYDIPDDRLLLSQELLLFENSGSDDLERVVDSVFSKARITLKVNNADAVYYGDFQETFYKDVKNVFSNYDGEVKITFTGLMAIMGETIPVMQRSLVNSYLIAFLTITPIMMFMLGSIRTGLLSMLPNIAPIALGVGFLGVFNVPMDTFMLMLGSIALGLAVDDTIHFMHNYQRNYRSSGDAYKSIQQSLSTSGQAILFTSIILGVSFLIYLLSNILAIQNFGFLMSLCILVAFLADTTLAPALVTIIDKVKTRKKTNNLRVL